MVVVVVGDGGDDDVEGPLVVAVARGFVAVDVVVARGKLF